MFLSVPFVLKGHFHPNVVFIIECCVGQGCHVWWEAFQPY